MNEITVQTAQLPNTIEQKAKYVLFGTDVLADYRAKLSAMKKAGISGEQYNQLKLEAQETAENVLLFGVDVGRHLQEIPKAQGTRSDLTSAPIGGEVVTKEQAITDLGFTKKQAEDLQNIARHPEVVERVIEQARENNDVPSRNQVLKEIKKPHIAYNSADNEWYTPKEYIEAAREVMGSIDLDPASNDFANETVRASEYFTEETDGLSQEWHGNIWMNPPYAKSLVDEFAEKLVGSDFEQAIVLVNNATETSWFATLVSRASAIVFHKGRIRFVKRDGERGAPLQGQAFLYFGNNPHKFLDVFTQFGWGALV